MTALAMDDVMIGDRSKAAPSARRETVRLVDERGVTVTVAADKLDARLRAGYTLAPTTKPAS